MLEIPEIKVTSGQLDSILKGKIITQVLVNNSPHKFAFYNGDPNEYASILMGKIITGANAAAGQIELHAEDSILLFSDGVNLRYYEPNVAPPEKHQLFLEFNDNSHLIVTIQMYGGIWAFIEGQNDNFYYLVTKQKPSPLSEEFDEKYFLSLFDSVKQTISVKAFLATEQRIPGLGNGVLQDILFDACIHPATRLQYLSINDKKKMFTSVKNKLIEMTEKGGRDTEKDLLGNWGGYQTNLSSRTFGSLCMICGGSIIRRAFLGGNVYFCPICQVEKK